VGLGEAEEEEEAWCACGASRVRFSALLGSIEVEVELTREDHFVTTPCCPHGKWELEERTWCTMLRSRGVAPRRLAALPRLGRGRNPERELPKSYDLCNNTNHGHSHRGSYV
jgi:hypothetical protein